ncbi:MAG TPA: xanthine dehydrogenase family protein molybdopterin-binding subunit, partial [Longimicrobiales bacterium]|nr:xanthine dehydrogenase family protein molybdopterin-binding subunit [Longimicrobiales bacterium]
MAEERAHGTAGGSEEEPTGERKPRFGKWTRRAFIGAGSIAGGGLVLGVGVVAFAPNRLRYLPEGVEEGDGHLTTWIKITPDNRTTVLVPHCEMGQGAITGIAMLLAEELDADWSLMDVRQAPAEDVYANGYVVRAFLEESGFAVPGWLERALDFGAFKMADFVGMQVTGGSTSTRGTGAFGMRVAGASARAMLVEAGAEHFGVPAEELTTRDSRVTHAASGRSATYGELASHASTLDVPRRPPLKQRVEYRLVGTSRQRRDIPSKVVGEAQYGIDVVLPDMLHAAIMRAPIPGGQLASVDTAPARAMPGVREVVQLSDAVAVVADGYWQAQQALDALSPQFTDAGVGTVDTQSIRAAHAAAVAERAMDEAPAGARVVEAEYEVPYLHHVTMEPMCATVRLTEGHCEVWAGTQDPLSTRGVAAEAAGLDDEDVVVHNQQLGGGFGRRLPGTYDYVEQAVEVAKVTTPRPVKLVWSREEDMRHGYYRPFVIGRFRGALDGQGTPLLWASRFTGSRFGDVGAATPPYAVGESDIRAVAPPEHLRTGAWRSVASSQHGFFVESFIDELAHAAGRDPFEYRRALLEHEPRHRAVLERVAELAGWGTPAPDGRARGIAIVESFGSIVAQVAEVGLDANGQIRVYRVDAAVDCGLVVNPQQAEAQVQGGIVFGLSAALFHAITVRDGAVEQRNFPDYPMIRMADAPAVRVAFVDSGGPIGGLGEPGVPPVAPAVANALFALTGQRLRTLPLKL